MTAGAEFPRPVRIDTIGDAPRTIAIEADEVERAALARRFGLLALDRLAATAAVARDGGTVRVDGRLSATVAQACIATGAPVPASIDEFFTLRFVPASGGTGGEIELDEADLDTIPYEGSAVDLGEAAAQTLALALDPFPRAPDAEAALRAAGVLSEEQAEAARRDASPFAALKALKRP